jgi:hypothetical protein
MCVFFPGQVHVPCCFCMLEFPTWNSSVTSHIASHVRINSVSCVECKVKFESKNVLMKHLYSSHTGLPYGVSFDVSINNYERRRHRTRATASVSRVEVGANSAPDKSISDPPDSLVNVDAGACGDSVANVDAGACGNSVASVSSVESQEISNDKQHLIEVVPINVPESAQEEGNDADIADKSACSSVEKTPDSLIVSSIDNSANSTAQEAADRNTPNTAAESENLSAVETSDKSQDADKTLCRLGRRKSRKPVRVAAEENEEMAESLAKDGKTDKTACDEDKIEILAATQPMAVQCSKCSYTCNTELNLKVCIHYNVSTDRMSHKKSQCFLKEFLLMCHMFTCVSMR